MIQTNEPLSKETIDAIFERVNQHQLANEPNSITITDAEYAKLKEDAERLKHVFYSEPTKYLVHNFESWCNVIDQARNQNDR